MGNAALKPFGIPPASEAGHSPHTEAELRTLIGQSEREGILDPEERVSAEGVFPFGDRRAHGRGQRTHTRLPLCEPAGDLDTAAGFVHLQSLLGSLVDDAPPELSELATPIFRTSEVVLLDELLTELRRQSQHMAPLDNEYGTAGRHRHPGGHPRADRRRHPRRVRHRAATPHRTVVRRLDSRSGTAPLEAVRTKLDLDVAEYREASLGGYLTETAGRVPDPGEDLAIGS